MSTVDAGPVDRPQRARLLLSYWYARKMPWDALLDTIRGWDVIVDSGAFSAYMSGQTIDVDAYAKWLTRWKGIATAAFSLDVIGDPVASMRNYRRLVDAAPGPTIVPVFHAGSATRHLDAILDTGATYVAFGGLVEHFQRRKAVARWAAWHLRHARDAGAQVHGLGFTSAAVRDLPFYTVDSSTWTMGHRRGFLVVWDADRHRVVQVQFRNPERVRMHASALRSFKVPPARIATSEFMRGERIIPDSRFCYETSARAFMCMDEYLRRRHQVPPPAPLAAAGIGTKVYLAASTTVDVQHIAGAWEQHTAGAGART